jgi:threonyl-tRNA synthetase
MIPEGQPIRMYWHGHWQDLCRGPHLQHTGQVPADAFKLMSVAGAYWRGDSNRPMLQRIYGVAFQNRQQLKDYLTFLEEAEKRDHRKPGPRDGPVPFPGRSAGHGVLAPQWLDHLPRCEDYMRRQLTRAGYREIKTPQVVDRKLWELRATGTSTARTCSSPRSTRNMPMRSGPTRSSP